MKPIDPSGLLSVRKAIIAQNDALKKIAQSDLLEPTKKAGTDFGAAMSEAIGQVNILQASASDSTQAYTMGETYDIASVILAKQKASLSFEATLQVRNKLIGAYKDIMSMPV